MSWHVGQKVAHEISRLDPLVEILQKAGVFRYPPEGPGLVWAVGWRYHILIEFKDGTRAMCLKSCLRPV